MNQIYIKLLSKLEEIYETKNKSKELFTEQLEKILLKNREFCYIQEYLECLKPITQSLDILQREENIH